MSTISFICTVARNLALSPLVLGCSVLDDSRAERDFQEPAVVERLNEICNGAGVFYEYQDWRIPEHGRDKRKVAKKPRVVGADQMYRAVLLVDLDVTGETIRMASRLPYLEEIYFGGPRVSNIAMQSPRALEDNDMITLQNLSSLKLIQLRRLGFSSNTFGIIGSIGSLERLEIIRCNLSGIISSELKHDRLATLHLIATNLKDDDLRFLSQLPNLKELVLVENDLTDSGMEYIAKLDHLESLDIRCNEITGRGIAKLKSLRNLRTLHIGPYSSEGDMKSLSQLPGLKELHLTGNCFSDKAMAAIPRLTIEKLSVTSENVTGACVPRLSVSTTLRDIDVVYTNIPRADVAPLLKMRGLEKLSFRGSTAIPTSSTVEQYYCPVTSCESVLHWYDFHLPDYRTRSSSVYYDEVKEPDVEPPIKPFRYDAYEKTTP